MTGDWVIVSELRKNETGDNVVLSGVVDMGMFLLRTRVTC